MSAKERRFMYIWSLSTIILLMCDHRLLKKQNKERQSEGTTSESSDLLAGAVSAERIKVVC